MKLLFTLAALFVATSAGQIDCKQHPYNVSGDPASYSNRCYRGNRQVRKCFFDQGVLCDGETPMQSGTRYKCTPASRGAGAGAGDRAECKAIESTKTQLDACLDRYCIISGQGSFIVTSGPRRRALAGRRLMPYNKAVEFCCDGENKIACDQLADQTPGFTRAGHDGWKAQQLELCKANGVECTSCVVAGPPRRRLAKRTRSKRAPRPKVTPCGWNTQYQCSRTYFKTCADKVSPSAYQEYCEQWMDDTQEQVSNDNEHAQKTPETDDRRMTVDTEAGSQKITTGSDTTVLIVCISLAVVFALALGVWVGRRTSEMKIPQDLEAEPISVETV